MQFTDPKIWILLNSIKTRGGEVVTNFSRCFSAGEIERATPIILVEITLQTENRLHSAVGVGYRTVTG